MTTTGLKHKIPDSPKAVDLAAESHICRHSIQMLARLKCRQMDDRNADGSINLAKIYDAFPVKVKWIVSRTDEHKLAKMLRDNFKNLSVIHPEGLTFDEIPDADIGSLKAKKPAKVKLALERLDNRRHNSGRKRLICWPR